MNLRKLGNTGIEVSEIAFGGVEIGMPYGIGVNSATDMPSRSESIRLLHDAFDGGINFFDTARSYGYSEEIMGQAFKKDRNQVIFSTKCRKLKNEFEVLPSPNKIIEIVKKSIEESLTALQTDYIDVYMLHQVDKEILENETVKQTFLELKKKGVIRSAGVSTYTVEESKIALDSGVWDVIQIPFNLMDQSQEVIFEFAKKKGIGIMVRSVLFKGILTNKGRNLHIELNDVQQHIKSYTKLYHEKYADLASLAIKFALSYEQIASVLVGIDQMAYLKKSLEVADGNYLDKEILLLAKQLQYPDIEFLDLNKWNRMGWLT